MTVTQFKIQQAIAESLAFPPGFMYNGKISVTVTSNNITVALKTMAGNDPSAADPVLVNIAGTTRKIVAALSVTKNAGISGNNICHALKGRYSQSAGYKWSYLT